MIRRELFAYTIMYIIGIAGGYIMLECCRILPALILFCVVGLIIGRIRFYDNLIRLTRIRLIACMLAGFSIFTSSFIEMNSGLCEQASVQIEGVISEVHEKDYGWQLIVKPDGRSLGRRLLVNCYSDAYKPCVLALPEENPYAMVGSRISASGRIRIAEGQNNPGCFDYRLYLHSRKIKYLMTAYSAEIEEGDSLFYLIHHKVMDARWQFEESFADEPDIRSLVKGVIFGDKGEISPEVREEFNENGTGHILAVSGLHIGFLFSLLRFMTKKRRTFAVSIGIVVILFMYGEMTMWSPSTVRAFIVMTVSLLSTKLRHRADLLTSVSLAALIILLDNPYALFNTGFQMSFAAMIGIAFYSGPLSVFIGDYLSILLAVQLAVAPLTAFVFHRFNPISVFINIPIVFLASLIVPLCIVEIASVIILHGLPVYGVFITSSLFEFLQQLNSFLNFKGGWSFYIRGMNSGLLIMIYALMMLLSCEWTRVMLIRRNHDKIRKAAVCIVMVSAALFMCTYNEFADDELVFVSVNQGDSLHIRDGSVDLLIDGGGNAEKNVGERILLPYLLSNGARDIDRAFVTHLHADHYKGISELASVFNVKEISVPDAYRHSYTSYLTDVSYVGIRDEFEVSSDCRIIPIWPVHMADTRADPGDNANEFNMVYIVEYRGIRTLVTGDLLEKDELDMLKYYGNTDVLKCDILKVGHHGSKSSSSEAFLDAVDPKIAVISVGANNMYGHPHAQTLERLEARGIDVYRTDINGAVGIDIGRNGRIKVDLMRDF